MTNKNEVYWKLCCTVFYILSGLTFSPLILSPGRTEPSLGGVPYTLWTTVVLGFALLLLTFIGTRVHRAVAAKPGELP